MFDKVRLRPQFMQKELSDEIKLTDKDFQNKFEQTTCFLAGCNAK
jgi:hypothetical protein